MNGDTTQIIGWSLVHFLWQGTVIALLLQGVLAGCRTAAGRYRTLMASLMLMLAAPLLTYWVLSQPEAILPPLRETFGLVAPQSDGFAAAPVAAPSPGLHFSVSWLVYAWLAGVTTLSVRWLGGWVWLERVRRAAEPVRGDFSTRCRWLINKIGVSKSVQFAQSTLIAVPMVVGWLRPVVLIPLSTLTTLSPQQLDAVILHELAHIKRLDAFANLFQILVETLLFYHPAVWWVSHRIRIERENCCDDIAVGLAGDSFGYAMALTMLEADRAFPEMALAATGGALKARVKRLLGREEVPSRPFHLAAVAVALIGLVVGGGALKAMAGVPHVAPPPIVAVAAPAEPAQPEETVAVAVGAAGSMAVVAPVRPVSPPAPVKPPVPPAKITSSSYIADMSDAGYGDLSPGELIGMKSVGLTPEEAKAWKSTGMDLSAGQLIGLHSAGVRPSDALGFQKAGIPVRSSEITSLMSVGVTPDYIRQMRDAGFDTDRVSDFMTAKSVGVTPDYVANLKRRGVRDLSPHRIITLKSSGLD